MLDDLARSGLTPADLKAFATAVGYSIPYFLPNGEPHKLMHRIRRTVLAPGEARYDQPNKASIVAHGYPETDASYPYLNSRFFGDMTWAQIAMAIEAKTLVLVEGEKKAVAVLKRLRLLAFGVGGCSNGVVQAPGMVDVRVLHPVIASLLHPGDTLEIVFDGDLATNWNVRYAAGTLRRALLHLGVFVRFVVLPTLNGAKMGIDDWLMLVPVGEERAAYKALPRVDGAEFPEHLGTLCNAFDIPLTGKGIPFLNERNLLNLIAKHERYAGKIWSDPVKGCVYDTMDGVEKVRGDALVGDVMASLQFNFPALRKSTVENVLSIAAYRFTHNPLKEWLDSLEWDGRSRFEWLLMALRVIDDPAVQDEYSRAVIRNFLLSAVARVQQPGCKADQVLILEGAQGIGKSRTLAALGGDYYVAAHERLDTKDFKVVAHTGWIVDIVELGGMIYGKELEAVKGMISSATDIFRKFYGRIASPNPRHFVLVGSTNASTYLTDMTGNRRFMPLACIGKIDVEWIKNNRDQIFAEAMHRYRSNEPYWELPASAAAVVAMRDMVDPWDDALEDILKAALDARQARMTNEKGIPCVFLPAMDILQSLGKPLKDRTRVDSMRLAALMRNRTGWEKNRPMVGGTKQRGYLHELPKLLDARDIKDAIDE